MLCTNCQNPADHDPRACAGPMVELQPRPRFVTRALVGCGVVGLVAGMMNVADGNGPTGILSRHVVALVIKH